MITLRVSHLKTNCFRMRKATSHCLKAYLLHLGYVQFQCAFIWCAVGRRRIHILNLKIIQKMMRWQKEKMEELMKASQMITLILEVKLEQIKTKSTHLATRMVSELVQFGIRPICLMVISSTLGVNSLNCSVLSLETKHQPICTL